MSDPAYCHVYVYTTETLDQVTERVAATLGGTRSRHRVTGFGLDVSVARGEYDEPRAFGGAGDFLFFPYWVEAEPVGPTSRATFAERIAVLINGLRAAGYDYVAACDFEDALPGAGRSARPADPWQVDARLLLEVVRDAPPGRNTEMVGWALRRRGPDATDLLGQLRVFTYHGWVAETRHDGRSYWTLTDAGRERLRALGGDPDAREPF